MMDALVASHAAEAVRGCDLVPPSIARRHQCQRQHPLHRPLRRDARSSARQFNLSLGSGIPPLLMARLSMVRSRLGKRARGAGQTIAIIDTGIDADHEPIASLRAAFMPIRAILRAIAGSMRLTIMAPMSPLSQRARLMMMAWLGSHMKRTSLSCAVMHPAPARLTPQVQPTSGRAVISSIAISHKGLSKPSFQAGARVINHLAWRGQDPRVADAVRQAVARAADEGVVVLVAAGNGGLGDDENTDPNRPNVFARQLAAPRLGMAMSSLSSGLSIAAGTALTSASKQATLRMCF